MMLLSRIGIGPPLYHHYPLLCHPLQHPRPSRMVALIVVDVSFGMMTMKMMIQMEQHQWDSLVKIPNSHPIIVIVPATTTMKVDSYHIRTKLPLLYLLERIQGMVYCCIIVILTMMTTGIMNQVEVDFYCPNKSMRSS